MISVIYLAVVTACEPGACSQVSIVTVDYLECVERVDVLVAALHDTYTRADLDGSVYVDPLPCRPVRVDE